MAKQSIYEVISNKVIEALKTNNVPWQKPWNFTKADPSTMAVNYDTQRPYNFLNQLFLGAGEYLTMTSVNKHNGKVKKGSHAKFAYAYFKRYIWPDGTMHSTPYDGAEKWDEDDNTRWCLTAYKVFNVLDCEGIEPHRRSSNTANATDTEEGLVIAAEDVVAKYIAKADGITIERKKASDSAYYQPSTDYIQVPMRSQYKESGEYYSTLFHEMAHSTGAEKRLNRKGITTPNFFGSHEYSKEELVAEMAAAMLCGACGVSTKKTFTNSVAYLQSWAKALEKDSKLFVTASFQAEKAARYIYE